MRYARHRGATAVGTAGLACACVALVAGIRAAQSGGAPGGRPPAMVRGIAVGRVETPRRAIAGDDLPAHPFALANTRATGHHRADAREDDGLVLAKPGSGAVLGVAPTVLRLTFAHPVDPRRSTVIVVGDAMDIVSDGVFATGVHHTVLVCRLRGHLRPGPYSVVYSVAPAGRPALPESAYLFSVAPVGPPVLPNRPVALSRHAGSLDISLSVPTDRVAHQTDTIVIRRYGRAVDGARLTLVGRSLDMDMGVVLMTVRALGHGRYAATGDVVMASDWQLTLTIDLGHSTLRTTFHYLTHY